MALVVALVVIIIGLYMWSQSKAGFVGNFATGSNLPQWQFGSMHAGMGGTIDRPATVYNLSAYHKALRSSPRAMSEYPRGYSSRLGRANMSGREGLAAGDNMPNWNNQGDGLYSYSGPDAQPDIGYLNYTQCPDNVNDWDPAATAEAQALATVGALAHSTHGEGILQQAITGAVDATDPKMPPDDGQLGLLAMNGGAP